MIVIVGSEGTAGRAIVESLRSRGHETRGLGHSALDIADREAVRETMSQLRPEIIINAAGDKRMDVLEKDPSVGYGANVLGVRNLAEATANGPGLLVHISADFVHDGEAREPISEDGHPEPISEYGRQKLAAEEEIRASCDAHYILRTAGILQPRTPGFVNALLRMASESASPTVVYDQVVSPIWVEDLADGITSIVQARPAYGTYNCAAPDHASWAEMARELYSLRGLDPDLVRGVSTSEIGQIARRPAYSVLSSEKWRSAGLHEIHSWSEALALAVDEHQRSAETK